MKVFFILTDGAGIRNFIHSGVLQAGGKHEITIGCHPDILPHVSVDSQITLQKLPSYQTTGTIETLRGAITRAEIIRNARKFSNPDFLFYILKREGLDFKAWLKASAISLLGNIFGSDSGVDRLRKAMSTRIERTEYFAAVKKEFETNRPDLVVCTHQRSPEAIAIMRAAQALKIPTASFIFSWDNLPKGTLMAEADHYLVWSEYMKREMLQYYPRVREAGVHVTGTPQFVPYFQEAMYLSREEFATRFKLNLRDTWICFSGDDELTSPFDPQYLDDLAQAIHHRNQNSPDKVQIIFRPSPADVSLRYDSVIAKFPRLIVKIMPQWKPTKGNAWSALIPQAEDFQLLCSIARHSAAVFNVGSTMAVDFSISGKPAAYFRYNARVDPRWDINKIYRFIHFYTMKDLDPVYWIPSATDIATVVERIIGDKDNKMRDAAKWQEVIARSPLKDSNVRVWQALEKIQAV